MRRQIKNHSHTLVSSQVVFENMNATVIYKCDDKTEDNSYCEYEDRKTLSPTLYDKDENVVEDTDMLNNIQQKLYQSPHRIIDILRETNKNTKDIQKEFSDVKGLENIIFEYNEEEQKMCVKLHVQIEEDQEYKIIYN